MMGSEGAERMSQEKNSIVVEDESYVVELHI